MLYKKIIISIFISLLVVSCATNGTKKPKNNSRTELIDPVSDSSPEMINLKLGVGYLKRAHYGDIDIALKSFKKAIKINPKFALAHSLLANVYDTKKLFDSAEKHYELSSKYNHGNPDITNNYANFLCQRGKYKQAIEKYQKIVNNPQYKTPAAAYENAGVCSYSDKNIEQAESFFRKALAINKKQINSLYYLLRIYLNKKKFMKARAFLQRVEQLTPSSPEMLASGYRIEKGLGNNILAQKYLNKLQNQFPGSGFLKGIN